MCRSPVNSLPAGKGEQGAHTHQEHQIGRCLWCAQRLALISAALTSRERAGRKAHPGIKWGFHEAIKV